jgi:hypothetical protein
MAKRNCSPSDQKEIELSDLSLKIGWTVKASLRDQYSGWVDTWKQVLGLGYNLLYSKKQLVQRWRQIRSAQLWYNYGHTDRAGLMWTKRDRVINMDQSSSWADDLCKLSCHVSAKIQMYMPTNTCQHVLCWDSSFQRLASKKWETAYYYKLCFSRRNHAVQSVRTDCR